MPGDDGVSGWVVESEGKEKLLMVDSILRMFFKDFCWFVFELPNYERNNYKSLFTQCWWILVSHFSPCKMMRNSFRFHDMSSHPCHLRHPQFSNSFHTFPPVSRRRRGASMGQVDLQRHTQAWTFHPKRRRTISKTQKKNQRNPFSLFCFLGVFFFK